MVAAGLRRCSDGLAEPRIRHATKGQAKKRRALENGLAVRAVETNPACEKQFGRAAKQGSARDEEEAA